MATLGFEFVLVLLLVYGTSYALKFLERYDIPILVVEILAGILFGSVLGLVGPETPGYDFFVSLAAFGLLLIMFEAGLELDPEPIKDRPTEVAILGVLTFVVPFVAGVGLAVYLGLSIFAAFLVGVTISTTSLGLVYPLLEDFGYLGTERGQLILAVTVLNDILSVVALAFGITLTSDHPYRASAIVAVALLFFFVVVPLFLVDHLERVVPESVETNPTKFAVFFAVFLAFAFELVGVHAILGGFFAGLIIAEGTHEGMTIEKTMKPVVNLVAPVFFFYVGMQTQIPAFGGGALVVLGTVLLLGIGSKIVGSLVGGAITGIGKQTTFLLASAMPGRLSISVAAASIGLTRGIISSTLYDSFIVLSALSVFVASLMFRYFAKEEQQPTGRGAL